VWSEVNYETRIETNRYAEEDLNRFSRCSRDAAVLRHSHFGASTVQTCEVTSAADIKYPIQSIADGVVVIDVSLDQKGAITGSNVVRDLPSLTSAAASSIQSWKFSPASILGKPVPSIIGLQWFSIHALIVLQVLTSRPYPRTRTQIEGTRVTFSQGSFQLPTRDVP